MTKLNTTAELDKIRNILDIWPGVTFRMTTFKGYGKYCLTWQTPTDGTDYPSEEDMHILLPPDVPYGVYRIPTDAEALVINEQQYLIDNPNTVDMDAILAREEAEEQRDLAYQNDLYRRLRFSIGRMPKEVHRDYKFIAETTYINRVMALVRDGMHAHTAVGKVFGDHFREYLPACTYGRNPGAYLPYDYTVEPLPDETPYDRFNLSDPGGRFYTRSRIAEDIPTGDEFVTIIHYP